jgi:hypothetical protein
VCCLSFRIALLVDDRIKPDVDIVFVANAIEIILKVNDLDGRRQRKIADHLKGVGAGNGIIIHIRGDIVYVDLSCLE